MNLAVSRLLIVPAFAVALTLGASTASAQSAKFNLPVEAHWGGGVLSPGEYTLHTPYSPSGMRMFYVHGDAGNIMALPIVVDSRSTSGGSYLKLIKVDGAYYVSEYVSSTTGTAMQFATPKPNQRKLVAEVRVLRILGS